MSCSFFRLVLCLFSVDSKIHRKYPSRVFFALFQIALMVMLFFYISETLGEISVLGSKYFPFVATGLAFQHFFSGTINAASEKLEEYRDYGVLEEILFSQFKPWKVILGAGFYGIVFSIAKALLIFSAVLFVFQLKINLYLFLMSFVASLLLAMNLSFVASCSFLMWKRFSLLEIGGSVVTLFLSGIYFPLDVLPKAVANLALANPLLHALFLFRKSLGFDIISEHHFSLSGSFIMILGASLIVFIFNCGLYQVTLKRIKQGGISNHF